MGMADPTPTSTLTLEQAFGNFVSKVTIAVDGFKAALRNIGRELFPEDEKLDRLIQEFREVAKNPHGPWGWPDNALQLEVRQWEAQTLDGLLPFRRRGHIRVSRPPLLTSPRAFRRSKAREVDHTRRRRQSVARKRNEW